MSNRGVQVTRMGWIVLSMVGGVIALVWWLAGARDVPVSSSKKASLPVGQVSGYSQNPVGHQEVVARQNASVEKMEPVPADVDEREWKSVVSQMAGWPNRDQEVKRMGAYLTFYHRAQKWAELQGKPDADISERQRLAQEVLDDIPGRVAQAEMTPMEARDLANRLLADTTPEGQGREWARQRVEESIKTASGQDDSVLTSRQQGQIALFKQRESEIRARWASVPESERHQEDLDTQLRGLAIEVFGSL